jgi:hypothetical protein
VQWVPTAVNLNWLNRVRTQTARRQIDSLLRRQQAEWQAIEGRFIGLTEGIGLEPDTFSQKVLYRLAEYLMHHPRQDVWVNGYCSDSSDADAKREKAWIAARRVTDYLILKLGVPRGRLRPRSRTADEKPEGSPNRWVRFEPVEEGH